MMFAFSFAGDNKEHSTAEALNAIANEFRITEDQQNQLLPSGNQKIFYNRVFWAKLT